MGLIPAQKWRAITTVRAVNPLAAALSARLARLTGMDIDGQRGTVRIGENFSRKYSGYADGHQTFRGMPTRGAAPSGAIRAGMGSGLPNSQAPWSEQSPLLSMIAAAQNPLVAKGKKT
jgi:hypothetical protein